MNAALLLAEPEPSVRGFLERQLRNGGFDVVSCERAEQLPRAADPACSSSAMSTRSTAESSPTAP